MPKNLKFLFASRTCSEFTQAMYPIVLPLFVLHLYGSLSLSSLFFTVISLPSIILLPLIGVKIEHFSKQKFMLLCLSLLSLAFFMQMILLFIYEKPSLMMLGILAILINVCADSTELASKVMFTELVDKKELEKYNGLKSLIDNLASFGAPILGTALYGFCGFRVVVLVAAILYLVSSFFMTRISYMRKSQENPSKATFWLDLRNGLVPIKQNSAILRMMLLVASLNFFVASSGDIINPGILIQKYHISSQLFGLVEVAFMLGVIIAGVFIARKSPKLRQGLSHLFLIDSFLMIGIGVSSLLMTGLSKFIFLSIFLVLQIGSGFVTMLINVPILSFYQSEVALDYQSRFFGLNSLIGKSAIALGVLYTGFLSQKFGADVTYILNNICVIVIVILVSSNGFLSLKNTNKD